MSIHYDDGFEKFSHSEGCVCQWCTQICRIVNIFSIENDQQMSLFDDVYIQHVAGEKETNSDDIRDDMAASNENRNGIIEWRKRGFIQIGFSRADAAEMADTKIELAAARNLHKQGCPPELIKRILWGTSFMGEEEDWVG